MQANLGGAEGDSSRRMGIVGACTSNMLNMIGVGPFLSIPLVLIAMHGSHILLAWLLGAHSLAQTTTISPSNSSCDDPALANTAACSSAVDQTARGYHIRRERKAYVAWRAPTK